MDLGKEMKKSYLGSLVGWLITNECGYSISLPADLMEDMLESKMSSVGLDCLVSSLKEYRLVFVKTNHRLHGS